MLLVARTYLCVVLQIDPPKRSDGRSRLAIQVAYGAHQTMRRHYSKDEIAVARFVVRGVLD